ncbi:flavin reductase family protein [Uliginosibacterium sp. H1]|uniref:flavin reductase family protein n=1 Tax=Uliginosibacterium sp. H1 TaxID=3114757 RepID=UPI002E18E17F|nr:flavin reductase family protein [Uliginosibacterium sp. H1]
MTASTFIPEDPRDPLAFRRCLGQFATGITVVTTQLADGTLVGMTINSFNSVSLEPPLVVWSLSLHLAQRPLLEACEYYAINVLAADQEAVSRRFASKQPDRFAGVEWTPGLGGAPLLPGCAASFEVRNAIRHAGGDHLVFIGEVERCSRSDREPLLYYGGRYRQLAPLVIVDAQN